VAGKMFEQGRGIRLKAGTEHALNCRGYASPEAELIRQAVTETAIVQAVGRARGVNRTAAKPVEVFMILHDTVTPLLVDEVVAFTDIEPDAIDEMIARGLVLQMPTDATKLHPDLFPSRNTAKQAYHRAKLSVERGTRLVTSPYREVPIRAPNHARVRYQPKGKGQLPRLALVDPAKVPDVRAHLEAVLGPLALFEVLSEAEHRVEATAAPMVVPEALLVPEAPLVPAPSPSPLPDRRPYQPDFFRAPVVDLDVIRVGRLPAATGADIEYEYRARLLSQEQFAAQIGLSPGQACNAVKGRFGLSPASAERLRDWMMRSA